MKRRFKLFKAHIAYKYACMKASRMSRLTGLRHFVLMTDAGKLMVMDRTLFYKLRSRGLMPRWVTPRMLPRIAVYHTGGMYKGHASQCMPAKLAQKRKQRYLAFVNTR